ncbi:MAG TPA: hypothetical protein VMV45_14225 [Casimicrobiaceae bacterium]|nr:hypothetical protein [Casimicrobiaceae bacterium]
MAKGQMRKWKEKKKPKQDKTKSPAPSSPFGPSQAKSTPTTDTKQ